ncbi:nitronate monooxygenase [Bacillus sp. FJAT-18017]|uniref:NAD(P)H-dependent flavin oxidoreductase n=1 Tax=Bacillus sp. FJAT-18017 TaxID=1705566 RepID=UPI0006AEC5EA|nr:nitronate monooxygenase [Bacillus sp. FJAT-18017]ALC89171.1 nitronate monooxygenase [Bacillus sp. FJAT-18017]
MLTNEFTKLLNMEYPIIQAPMAGGITTSRLVAAVSNSGGLGMVGAGYMSPEQLRIQIREIRKLTSGLFGINLFVPNDFSVTEEEVRLAQKAMQPVREQLGLQENADAEIPVFPDVYQSFVEQVKVVIEEQVSVCSFTFGIPSEEVIGELKRSGIMLIGTATTVREAIELGKAGMDAIVVQGSEAGGHRGSFLQEDQESLVGLMSLIPQVVDNVNIPVIAAGGIMDGRGLMASLCLGAKAVQMGTAFLTCVESGAHNVYKKAILAAKEDETVLTRSFSGKWARGIKNKFINEMQIHESSLPDFPVQNILTQSMRKAASSQNNPDFMSLWSGQSPRLTKDQTAEALIHSIIAEAEKLISH